MPAFRNARVALLEARMSGEIAGLVERLGGRPYSVPALREAPIPDVATLEPFLNALGVGCFSLVVFLTGAGVTALLREAERLERLEETIDGLRNAPIACRGPKPAAVLRRHHVPIQFNAAEPYTTTELLEALKDLGLTGARVAIVHYGERNNALAEALAARGADLEELCLYEWLLPEDLGPLHTLVGELIAGAVDAIAFTSQVQCRHLFQVAAAAGRSADLISALNARTIVASIGPVCDAALRTFGVVPRVQPAHPKMGALISALADHIDRMHRQED
jgi:uroporphyrinogen-III synthase